MDDDMKQTVAVINGPNINMLGSREISVYGEERWADIEKSVSAYADRLNLEVIFYQSNHEGAIVDFIQQNAELLVGIIINPAAFTKTGFSVLDALTARRTPYIEVHLTNLMQRGGWHSESIFTEHAIGFIMGFRGFVYQMGIQAMNGYLEETMLKNRTGIL